MLQYILQWNHDFGTTEGIENWFAESKVKMKCSTMKGNNLGFELLRIPVMKILPYEVYMRDKYFLQ